MMWKEKIIKLHERSDLETMLQIGRNIEDNLPKIKFYNSIQFQHEIKLRDNYIYREIIKKYEK